MRLQRAVWCLAALCLGSAQAQEEVPFITTPDRVTLAMLELAQVKAGEHVIDLGSGDGRIVITAARRFKATGLGVEIDPNLVTRSRENAQRAGVAAQAQFREQDLFLTDLSAANVITIYLLPQLNLQLRPRLLQLKPGTRIVSHDWDMGDWLPDESRTLDVPEKAIGREKKSTVYLWRVPAPVAGLWCGPGVSLAVTQRFSQVSATLQRAGEVAPAMVFDGRMDGRDGQVNAPHAGVLHLQGEALQVRGLGSAGGAALSATFVKAGGAGCPGV